MWILKYLYHILINSKFKQTSFDYEIIYMFIVILKMTKLLRAHKIQAVCEMDDP